MRKRFALMLAIIQLLLLCAGLAAAEGGEKLPDSVKLTPGDHVFFGEYEQDGDMSNGAEPIEWLTLDVQYGKALLISRYALDARPYNANWAFVTWEDCTLRQWLNGEFLNAAFSPDEQYTILVTDVDNGPAQCNGAWLTTGGGTTRDRLFLLSYAEADRYFKSDAARMCAPTDNAVAHSEFTYARDKVDGRPACWWWLRSPGSNQRGAADVYTSGSIDSWHYVTSVVGGVRPAMWLDLDMLVATGAGDNSGSQIRIEAGSVINFGRYEQYGGEADGAESIKWIVLCVQDGKALLLSLYGLDTLPYNDENAASTWESCSLRKWLNTTFLQQAFTEEERSIILLSDVANSSEQGIPEWKTDASADTQDRVFLLSYAEVCGYFSVVDPIFLMCPVTDFAVTRGAAASQSYTPDGSATCWWWLRSPGEKPMFAAFVYPDGVRIYCKHVTKTGGCVRPALWIDLGRISTTSKPY